MFINGEVERFLRGELGSVLVIQHEGDKAALCFESDGHGSATAYVPLVDASSFHFDIERALSDRICEASFRSDGRQYIIDVRDRTQFYGVCKIACNYLGWLDEAKMSLSYRAQLPVERLAS